LKEETQRKRRRVVAVIQMKHRLQFLLSNVERRLAFRVDKKTWRGERNKYITLVAIHGKYISIFGDGILTAAKIFVQLWR
jgi:hypothetical protein